MTFNGLISEVVDEMLEHGRLTIESVRRELADRHGDAIIEEGERLADLGINRLIKECLRKVAGADGLETDEPSQMRLPGFREPRAIAVPIGESGEYEYVAYSKAVLRELEAARLERTMNVFRATRRLEDYDMKLDVLRPIMEGHPRMTVEEALRKRNHQGVNGAADA